VKGSIKEYGSCNAVSVSIAFTEVNHKQYSKYSESSESEYLFRIFRIFRISFPHRPFINIQYNQLIIIIIIIIIIIYRPQYICGVLLTPLGHIALPGLARFSLSPVGSASQIKFLLFALCSFYLIPLVSDKTKTTTTTILSHRICDSLSFSKRNRVDRIFHLRIPSVPLIPPLRGLDRDCPPSSPASSRLSFEFQAPGPVTSKLFFSLSHNNRQVRLTSTTAKLSQTSPLSSRYCTLCEAIPDQI